MPFKSHLVNGRFANVFQFVRKEAPDSGNRIVVMALVAGISNAGLLGLINAGAAAASQDSGVERLFLMFAVALGLFITSKHYILGRSIMLAEDIINNIRVRLSNKVRHAELPRLESLSKSEIYSRITTETTTISQSAPLMIDACQSAIVILFVIIYIGFLSLPALFVTLGLIAAGIVYYLGQEKELIRALRGSSRQEVELFESLTHVLDGFKEIKVNQAKSDDVFSRLEDISQRTRDLKVATGMKFINNVIFSQAFFYILLGVNIFILPQYSPTQTHQLIQISAAILFIVGPLSTLVSSVQVFATANVAVESLYNLDEQLGESHPIPRETPPTAFREIELSHAEFGYTDAEGQPLFRIGPIDLKVKAGETIFLVGGNGSGKSTFLKLLTGLYRPERGSVQLDGELVSPKGVAHYRELFSLIFTDYHLFDRLYGLKEVDLDRVKELLKMMELDKKTALKDGAFTNLDLSDGQKKRLALITAILEDRPVYVFDEWAADQDPPFRKFFYEEILRDFKKRGKTVIAATHDDKYFHTADRILKMDYGVMSEQKPK